MAVAPEEVDPEILRQAAAWRIRLFESDLESSFELELWLSENPLHERAWAQTEKAWDHVSRAEASAPGLERAKPRALPPRRTFAPFAVPLAAAAAIALVVTVGVWNWRASQPTPYMTAQGERRTVVLSDGSSVAMDSGTSLDVRYTAHVRDLRLLQGQARFEVAHDASRPFRVKVRNESVEATGTNFNIDILASKTLVTLLQGRVTVSPQRAEGGWTPVRMVSGQQLAIADTLSRPNLRNVDVGDVVAWESGAVIFKDEPLSTAAERISRYAKAPIVVDDPSTAALRISGAFQAGDVPGFVDAVTAYLPVKASGDPEKGLHLGRRP